MQSFENIAAYYEILTNAAARLEREGPLLSECLAQAPGRRVLDLACGTGLHAHFFAEQGAQVTALDASEAMIRHARALRPHPAITYGVCDMRAAAGGPWDLAVCLGNSLALLPSGEDLDAVFARVAAALAPGGRFLVQLVNTAAPGAQAPRHRVERKDIEDGWLVAVKSLVPHGGRTLLSLAFFAGDQSGVRQTATDTAVLSHWSPGDLDRSAASVGMHCGGAWGDFDRTPFDGVQSTDFIAEFHK